MWSVLVTCEHASGATPPGLDLGLTAEQLASHISMDRGSGRIAEGLARALEAPLHRGRWSRLVVDLNRREDNPAVILAETYGVEVPGNRGLSQAEREARLARWHRPYREAARADASRLARAGGCLHVSVHSFDPALDPEARAFDAGVLFDPAREPEAEAAARIAEALRRPGLDVRSNEPYSGTPEGLTSWLRAQLPASRYVGLELEAQRDRVPDDPARDRLAEHVAEALRVASRWLDAR